MDQKNVEQQCMETFYKNMDFFHEHYPNLAKNVLLLSQAIELEMYKEKWSLEYKDEEGYFDLLNLDENYYYYDKNSENDADDIAQNTSFDKANSFNNLKAMNNTYNYKLDKEIEDSGLEYTFPLYNYVIKHRKKSEYKKIDKFIFIGTGLGLHIKKLSEKLKSKAYIIIEPNLEIFRLSMFVTDYTDIVKDPDDLILSIASSSDEFSKAMQKFIRKFHFLNNRFKFHCITENYHGYFDAIANMLSSSDPMAFPFSITLQSTKRIIDAMNEHYKYLHYDKDVLKDYPVCLVAPGPSLEKCIDWLKENQNKYIIVALAASLKKLEKHDIKPDIITSVDPYDIIEGQFNIDNKSIYKDSKILFSANTHPDVLKNRDKDNVYLYPVLFNIARRNLTPIGGSTIGEVTYGLSLLLGAQELYIIGLDAALDQETGASHAKGHAHFNEKELKRTDIKEFKSIKREDVIEIDGNQKDKVFASRKHYGIVQQMNQFTRVLKKDQKVYNTTEGAKFKDIDPIKCEDIKTPEKELDKKEISEILKERLDKKAKDEFDFQDVALAEYDLEQIEKIITLIKQYNKKKFKDYDTFQYDRLTLMIEVGEISKLMHSNVFTGVINGYQAIADKYLFDFFEHSPEMKKNKKHINTVNKHWLMPYKKIALKVKELLQKIVDSAEEERKEK